MRKRLERKSGHFNKNPSKKQYTKTLSQLDELYHTDMNKGKKTFTRI